MRLRHLLQGLSYPCTIEIKIPMPSSDDVFYIRRCGDITKIKYTWTDINYIMEYFGDYKVIEYKEISCLNYEITLKSNV